jgi:hypothetical protein
MAQYRLIKRKDGRTQRAMVLANGRLKFVKNTTGRKARKQTKTMAKRRRSKSRRSPARRYHLARMPRRTRRRRGGGGGGALPVLPIALSAAGLAYLTGNNGPKQVREMAMKIPGAKTFGPLAVAGGACLVIDRFVKRNKWLKLAGIVGVAAAAMKVGEQGANFKWLGDVGDDSMLLEDVGDDDDMGDVGDDDDMGDYEE